MAGADVFSYRLELVSGECFLFVTAISNRIELRLEMAGLNFVDRVVVRRRGCLPSAGLVVGRQPARQAVLRERCFTLSIRLGSGECFVGVAAISNPFHCRLEIAGLGGGSSWIEWRSDIEVALMVRV